MERFVVVPQFTVDAFMALPEDTVGMAPNIITSRFEHILKKTGLVQTSGTTMHLYSMQAGGWGNDKVLEEVYRHTLSETRKKMNTIALSYFETMQHEIQHENKKAQ